MKICYLILAHNQPAQLFRLYNALNQSNSDFYIHIDKKSTCLEEILHYFESKDNVKVISAYNV